MIRNEPKASSRSNVCPQLGTFHNGVAAPVLTAAQKEAGRKWLRAELRAKRARERQPVTQEWKGVVGDLFFDQVEV